MNKTNALRYYFDKSCKELNNPKKVADILSNAVEEARIKFLGDDAIAMKSLYWAQLQVIDAAGYSADFLADVDE